MATFTGLAGTNNTFTGSAAADAFLWAAADLNNLDIATGGGGADVLRLTTAGTLAANALAGISGIPSIVLAAGGNGISLLNSNFTGVAGAKIFVTGGIGHDTIDATAVTGANALVMLAGGGLDVLRGGAGADAFRFAAADLASDTVQGGGGSDLLQLTTAGVLGAAALSAMTGVETISLANGTNGITLLNGNLSGVAGAQITVLGNTGADTIDASGLTGTNAVLTVSGGGLDVLRGGAGADIFRFAAADLASDTVQGGGGGDLLQLTTAGVLGAAALSAMTGVETISLATGTNGITLLNGNLSGVAGARITVFGNTGADTIDASGLTGANAAVFNSGAGLDMLRGGAGADRFRFAAADLAGDTVQGGAGIDLLEITAAGVLAANALANMTGVENIAMAAGTSSVTLVNGNLTGVANAKLFVFGNSGNDTIDASGLTGTNAVQTNSGTGLDVLRGGAGADIFRFAAADLASDTIVGGGGNDLLQLTTAGVLGAAALSAMTGVETISLAGGTNGITLLNGNLSGVAGARINVFGVSGNDTIDASGLTGTNAVLTVSGSGLDVVRGGAGADTFRFAAADLAGDTVVGGAGADTLQLTSAGVLGAAALSAMSAVESIVTAAGTNGVTLLTSNFAGVTGGQITVFGNTGNDTFDASGVTGSANGVVFNAFAGSDVLKGGAGADTFRFTVGELAGDTVQGGGGNDRLELTTAGVLGATALSAMIGVETIALAAGTNAITLVNGNLTGLGGARINVFGNSGNDTITAAGLTGTNAVQITSGAGLDVLTGGAGVDVFRFAAADLAGDTVNGGGGSDRLEVTTAGVLGATALSGMTAVENITLAAGTNSITFVNGNLTGVAGARLFVFGNSGNDTINASGLTGSNAVTISSGAGLDVLLGGAGADTFRFAAADLAGDTVSGGLGNDRLELTTAGVLGAGALSAMTEVETITLFSSGTNGITLVDGNFSATNQQIAVIGGSGNDTVNGSGLTGIRTLDVTAGAGLDVLRGGAGADTFRFAATDLTAGDTVQGGGRLDTLRLTTAGVLAADALTGVNGVDKIILSAGGNEITLTDANYIVPLQNPNRVAVEGSAGASRIDASGLTGSNALLYFGGGGDDTVLGGAGADEFNFLNGNSFTLNTTITGGAGFDTIYVDQSMDFLSNTISGVEGLISFADGAATVTISGVDARSLTQMGSFFLEGATQTFNIQLRANENINFSNLTLLNRDAGDAIHVIGSSGSTRITLSADIASYTGGTDDDTVFDRGGVQVISLGEGNDGVFFLDGNLFATGDTINGGGGDFDQVRFDRSMDFLGDTITNVEELIYQSASDANVTISGENAARLSFISNVAGLDGFTQSYSVQLSAGSTTDLSQLSLFNADAGDAINVVSTSGNTAVTLSASIARFTGSADADTVSLAPGVQYRLQSVIDGGGGDDRIAYDGSVDRDVQIYGGSGNDTLVVTGAAAIDLSNSLNHIFDPFPNATVNEFENVDASASTAGVTLTGRNDVYSRLRGGSEGDTITAGAGGAEIIGGLGGDTLTGGSETDVFVLRSTEEAQGDSINGAAGNDRLMITNDADLTGAIFSNIEILLVAAHDEQFFFLGNDVTATVMGGQLLAFTNVRGNALFNTIETLVVNADTALLNLSGLIFEPSWRSEDRVVINGTSGNDNITGTSRNDVIAGATGGFDTLSGGGGNDVIGYDFGLSGNLDGGTDNDTVRLDSVRDGITPISITVDLAAGLITEFANGSSPFGFNVTNFDNADFSRSTFNTELIGTDTDNTLIGGSEADTITGGLGADTMTGGGGADSFVWDDKQEGGDTITDFFSGTDTLKFTAAAFAVDGAFGQFRFQESPTVEDITGVDTLTIRAEFDTAAEVRAYLDTQTTTRSHGMFVVVADAALNTVMYYTSNATAGGANNAVFQIADLGIDKGLTGSDFVFV